ncbi:MAG: DapH/DapD/GlmU-related protein [Emcibacteraceae bacterium]|nr:DapH/DapD/GlmU-related protein [Emcibacteraceae bacterium]
MLTKLFFRRAKMIRSFTHWNVRGRLFYKNGMNVGKCIRVDIFKNGVLSIGKNFQINDYCHIACVEKITIGSDVLIASKVFITDHDHRISDKREAPILTGLVSAPVAIGDRVWLGENVTILKGVTIGEDVIIGSNSVVTKSLLEPGVYAGVPVKFLYRRELND